ncbi:glycosyltransferase family 4 protein [Providencia sp. Je.9.19]|uniref:glycosyltransferase family 4 protein n=1 Tax=Providencia sp. Je.9.19 TaxID=3142844 RepID=UPI003DA91255
MKLVYIVPSLDNVGPTNVVLALVKQLSNNNEITIISFRSGILENKFNEYCNIYITKNIFKIFGIISDKKAIVHSHGFFPDLLNAIIRISRISNNNFSTIHNFIKLDYILLKGKYLGSFYAIIHKIILKMIKYPINCSKSAMMFNKISNYYIYNGVDDHYDLAKNKPDDNKINLVYLGVLNKRKNPHVFLEAFKKRERKNLILYVVGNGEEYSTLKSNYESDNIRFTGKIENPFSIINKCDFVISSSLAEGFPLAILEGLSCGLSYILSNIPPHIEIHELANHNGFLIENNPSCFDDVFTLLEKYNPYEFKKNCRVLYLEKFTTEKMVEEYTNLYISSFQ